MRTNSTFTPDLTNAILSINPRNTDCRVTIRDDRLRFSDHAVALAADKFLAMSGDNGYETHDVSANGSGIVRVVAKIIEAEWRLAYQWVPSPNLSTWPAWVSTVLAVRPNSKPAVFGTRIFYCGIDNKLHVADLNTTTGVLTDTVIGWSGGLNGIVPDCKIAFAPVSRTICYVSMTFPGSDTSLLRLAYLEISETPAYISYHEWAGRIHCDEEEWGSFDAVRLNNFDYLYMSINTGRRAMCVTSTIRGAGWSDPQDIFPLDYSDEIAKMIIGGASVIDNKVFVTGTLIRSSNDQPMQIYTMGPEHYTAGRDMFIGSQATTMFTKEIDSEQAFFRAGHGQLVIVPGYVYFVVPGAVCRAERNRWTGGSNGGWTYTCNNLAASFGADGSGSLTLDVPANFDPAIQPGMVLIVEPYLYADGVGGWFQLGEFEIDAITTPRTEGGTTKSIVARPKGIKRLAQWKSDASYDYWSQDARVAGAGDMSVNVRVTNFSGTSVNGVLPTEHDKPALLYSTCRPGMSYAARVRIAVQDGRTIYTGPMVSVYTETKAQAAARLGVDVDAIEGAMVKTSGLLLMYTNSGTPGWYLYLVDTSLPWSANGIAGCPYTKLAGPVACTLAAGQYDVMIVYAHGRIDTFYKAVEATAWTRALPVDQFDLNVAGDYLVPYSRSDGRGRAGYFARSEISQQELTARTQIVEAADDAIKLANPTALTDATRIFLDPAYSGVTELLPREATIGASLNTNPEFSDGSWSAQNRMIWHIPNQAMYASVGPGCTPQPWPNPEKTALGALDANQWVWASYPNDSGYKILGKDHLSGKILEIAYQQQQDAYAQLNQKAEIVYVDTQPPEVWIPNYNEGFMTFSGTSGWVKLVDNGGFNHVGDPAWGHWSTGEYLIPEQGSTGRYAVGSLGGRKIVRFWVRGKWYIDGAFQIPGYVHVTYHHPWENPRARSFIHPGVRVQHNDILKNQTTGNGIDHPLVNWYVYGTGGGTPEATQFIIGSGEPDRSFTWMADEICRKAGVLKTSAPKEVTTFSHSLAGWDLATDRAATMRERSGSAIIRFKKQLAEVGIFGSDTGGQNGNIVTIGTFDLKLYSVDNGAITLKESMNIAEGWHADRDSWVTMSYNDDRCSIWSNDTLLCVFEVTKGVEEFSLAAPEIVGPIEVDWPVLDVRVDNFVMDINQGGMDLLRRLIKRKRVRFLDDSTGGIKIFRDGDVIGSEAEPLVMSQVSNTTESDLNRITRVRLEGVEVYETADENALVEYGNVFTVENFDELELLEQFAEEGALYLEDVERAGQPRTYTAPADPRIEPWDTVWINDGSAVKQILAKQIRFNLSISEDAAIFNMTIDGEEI